MAQCFAENQPIELWRKVLDVVDVIGCVVWGKTFEVWKLGEDMSPAAWLKEEDSVKGCQASLGKLAFFGSFVLFDSLPVVFWHDGAWPNEAHVA